MPYLSSEFLVIPFERFLHFFSHQLIHTVFLAKISANVRI
jgi:hypothetical protein